MTEAPRSNAQIIARGDILLSLAGPIASRRALQGGEPGWVRHRSRLEITALHECAHGIVAQKLGFPVRKVSIVPNEYSAGRCHIGKPGIEPESDYETDQWQVPLRDHQTAARLCSLLMEIDGIPTDWRSVRKRLRELQREAAALVEEAWAEIEFAAAGLLREKELDREQFTALTEPRRRNGWIPNQEEL